MAEACSTGGTEGQESIYRKAYLRFVLDVRESSSSKLFVKQQGNNDVHRYVILIPFCGTNQVLHYCGIKVIYRRGLRRCLS